MLRLQQSAEPWRETAIRIIGSLCVAALLGLAACAVRPPDSAPPSTTAAVSPSLPPAATAAGPVVSVPASIDATGQTDTTDSLLQFIASVPNGSVIAFPKGGTYRLDTALAIAGRRNLTFEGNGATLVAGGGTTEADSIFWLEADDPGNRNITVRGFVLVGNSTQPGVYVAGKEGAHGVLVDGGVDIEIADVTISGVWGDCFYVGTWANRVWFHDSTCVSNGRNGLTITAGQNVTVEQVAFDKSGYSTFDIEPNHPEEGARSVSLRNNTIGTWTNTFLSASGAAGSKIDGVDVTGNTVTGATLLTIIDVARRQNIQFASNTALVAGDGPILTFAHVDGLTILNNVQPLRSGALADITDSTNVVNK